MPANQAHEFLEELERLVSREEFTAALAVAAEFLAVARDAQSEAYARFYFGLAQIRLAQTDLGATNIRKARATFESLTDPQMVVECLDWEARALYLNESSDALPLAEEALRRCRLLRPVPEAMEARIHVHLGAIHTLRREWAKAITSYEAAMAAQEGVREVGHLTRMYNDLSIAYLETGDRERSLTFAKKALGIHSMVKDEALLARVENNLGLTLMRLGMLDAAEERLTRSFELCVRLHLERGRSHVLLTMGELQSQLGDFDKAEVLVYEAIELAGRLDERMTLATGNQWLGWLRAQRGDSDGADAAFQRALALLSDVAASERLAECHVQYAHVLEARGDIGGAVSHWKHALGIVHIRRLAAGSL